MSAKSRNDKIHEIIQAVPERRDNRMWQRTILFQSLDTTLLSKIEKLATNYQLEVFNSEPYDPDLVAIPHFISIVDREIVGKEAWELYVRYIDETEDYTPMVITGSKDFRHWLTPKYTRHICHMPYSNA